MRIAIALAALLLSFSLAEAAERRAIVSIVPPHLAAGEFIGKFEIYVDGATVLAACHIPFGWRVNVGMFDGNSGILAGEGGLGGSLISQDNHNVGQLDELFLVELNPGVSQPKFSGSIEIGRFGADDRHQRTVKVGATNLRLASGGQCTSPRE
jgi:hypothetical protein